MKQCFIEKNFNDRHQVLIETSEAIMEQYAAAGYDLSLRQLFYQHVSHHGLPNTEQSYKMLGGVISEARLAGLLRWDLLVDRGRNTVQNSHWRTPADIIDSAAHSFQTDLWRGQRRHVEVMVEKQALEGILLPVCRRWDVPFTSNRGYSSSSAMFEAGQRIKEKLDADKQVCIVYMGDHDPSGIDMTRDVDARLMLFSEAGYWDDLDKQVYLEAWAEDRFHVDRIALNMPQIRRYNPPPNPTKLTDSRATGYLKEYGRESWELDALDPQVLAALVTSAIERHISKPTWERRQEELRDMRDTLAQIATDYRAGQVQDVEDETITGGDELEPLG